MAVDVWTDAGEPAAVGERGELVCTEPFPSMPLRFWGDEPDGAPDGLGPRYRAAYFERFAGDGSGDSDAVWAHGDFATWSEHGGMVIHGRSDTTLNPGGVRIGTAEIYLQVEQVDGVAEALVFGQQVDDDVRIVLLVRLGDGPDGSAAELTDEIALGLILAQATYNLNLAAVAEAHRLEANEVMASAFDEVDYIICATNPDVAFAADIYGKEFGLSERMLGEGQVHLLASDAHSSGRQAPEIGRAHV